jgi:tetratricopeptide (TPR) repeat protein
MRSYSANFASIFFVWRLGCACVLLILTRADVLAAQATRTPQELLSEAQSLQRAGKLDQAINDYRLFLKQYPNIAQVRSDLGAALSSAGRYEEAIVEYKRALPLNPLPQIRLNLALACYKINKLNWAVENLVIVHKEMPKELRVVTLLADCYLRMGDNKKVIDLLIPLEQTPGDDLAVIYMLGTALVRDGQVARGQVIIDQILKNGDSAEARLLLGCTKLKMYDALGALVDLRKAIELNPNLLSAHAYLGHALNDTDNREGAKEAYRAELKINPNDFDSNLYLGVLLKGDQQYEEALRLLKHALEVHPGDVGVIFQIATVHLAMQNLNDAQRELEALVKVSPDFIEAHIVLARLYYRLKRTQDGDREQAIIMKLNAEKEAREAVQQQMREGEAETSVPSASKPPS